MTGAVLVSPPETRPGILLRLSRKDAEFLEALAAVPPLWPAMPVPTDADLIPCLRDYWPREEPQEPLHSPSPAVDLSR